MNDTLISYTSKHYVFSLMDDIVLLHLGKVVDVRTINRTRSGRLSVPTLDRRYGQSIIVDDDEILGVSIYGEEQVI